MNIRTTLAAAVLAAFLSCNHSTQPLPDDSGDTWRSGNLSAAFHLATPNGEVGTDFKYGEVIVFHYVVKNLGETARAYSAPQSAPLLFLEIRTASMTHWRSDAETTVLVLAQDTLAAGDSLQINYECQPTQDSGYLQPGEYQAVASPRFAFDGAETPQPLMVPFSISCPEDEPDYALPPQVIITDEPAPTLWRDYFNLNNAVISGNTLTLTVSYGGGCQPHDFALYMTPATFMESYPVQANLVLRHNAHSDECKAYLTQDIQFNLRPIADRYRFFYGGYDNIILNIRHHPASSQAQGRSITYSPR